MDNIDPSNASSSSNPPPNVPAFTRKHRPASMRKRAVDNDGEGEGPLLKAAKSIEEDTLQTRPLQKYDDLEKTINENTIEDSKLDYAYPISGVAGSLVQESVSATANAEYETAPDRDHRARRETAASLHEKSLEGVYLGRSNYLQFIERRDTSKANALSDKNFRAGPMRLTQHIRTTCRFDYAPDLCKDYNETGFCGFGDSCKFVHDRGDYKSGWELELEWDERQHRETRERQQIATVPPEEQEQSKDTNEISEDLCGICNNTFTQPILITKCKHKFCEKCALTYAKTSKLCKVCGSPHNGQFQVVKMTLPIKKS